MTRSRRTLEEYLQSKLVFSSRICLGGDHAEMVKGRVSVIVVCACIGLRELRVIQEIERFVAELNIEVFSGFEILEK